jgi:hypothetical protein
MGMAKAGLLANAAATWEYQSQFKNSFAADLGR